MSTEQRSSDTLGPFTLETVIGSGGFGMVYRAHDASGRRVALKVLAPHLDRDDAVRRFEREAGIRIDHPNVVKVIAAGHDAGYSYIAFELLEGKPLTEILERAPLTPDFVVDMALQICAGLSAAHARGVVHRDLKPGNVFLQGDGVLKILDFGIARSMSQASPALTLAGTVIGTPGYLAPEQARGEATITPAADLWALGVLLYEALTGTNPFIRPTLIQTILAVVLEEAPPLSPNLRLPPGLADVIYRALAKDPKQRWESAEAFAMALHDIDLEDAGRVTEIAPSIADEQRVVALLLATEVYDMPGLAAAVSDWGGELIPMLGAQAIGLFGGRTYEGDESARAAAAALRARDAAGFIAVASGRASGAGGTVGGEVLRAVERAADAKLPGVAVDAVAARSLATQFALRVVSSTLYEIPAESLPRVESGRFIAVRDDLPLLGRQAELAALERVITQALDENKTGVVWVSGPPGVGKSRLRAELERRLRARRVAMLAARGESHRGTASLYLLASALRSEATLEASFADPSVSVTDRHRALSRFLRTLLEDEVWARQCAEPLARLLGLPEASAPITFSRPSDPQLVADRVRVALADVLDAMSARGPLALVLDDAQWADDPSLDFLDDMLRRLEGRSLLVFVAARNELEEARPELFAHRRVTRIAPHGLTQEDVATLGSIIARRAVPAAIVEEISNRTGGNPFFVEQIVRELVEQKMLDRELDTLPIPIDVEGAVQSRLDHLPFNEKQLCKRAAVFSGAFTYAALVALDSSEPEPHLGSLVQRGLIVARNLHADGSEREYRFKNALIAEVAYRMNTDDARRTLHAQAARFWSIIPDADREELARHYELGGRPRMAATAYAEAALRAARRGDSRSVLRCGERALAIGISGPIELELHLARCDAFSFLGRRDEQREAIDAALAVAETPKLRSRVLAEKAALLAGLGEHDEGLEVIDEAISAARKIDDPDLLAVALTRRAWLCVYSGQVHEAGEALDDAVRLSARVSPETQAMIASWRAQQASALGDLGERKRAYEEALLRYRDVGDLRRAASSECNLADTYNRVGAYEQAESALRQAIHYCQRVGNRVVEGYAMANLGYAICAQGRLAEGLAMLDAALARATELDEMRLALATRVYRVRALVASHDPAAPEEARSIAAQARENGLIGLEAQALAVRARSLLAIDPPSALLDAQHALSLRDEIGTLEEDEAEVFVALAEALERNGHEEEAREVVTRGASRIEFLASRIADADWRTRFRQDVAFNRRLLELAALLS